MPTERFHLAGAEILVGADIDETVRIAAGQFAIGAIRLPGWARLRRKQMEEISGRLPLATGTSPGAKA